MITISKSNRRRLALGITIATGVALVGAGILGVRWVIGYPDRPLRGLKRAQKLEVKKGATFSVILRELRRVGVVEQAFMFRFFAQSSGLAYKIRPGKYTLRPGLTPRKLLKILVKGPKVKLVRVTIPEGKHMLQVATILATAGVADEKELIKYMRHRGFVRQLGITEGRSAEGYLFPDTYLFRPKTDPKTVVRTLVRRSQRVLRAVKRRHPSYMMRLRNRYRFSDHDIVIMASIVEKETGVPRERPLIAGVFLNRLHLARWPTRRLETDPTIIYGCTVPEEKSAACLQFRGRIRRIHLTDKENRYNTYQHAKLPPGPISNPGRAALEAVVRPTPSRYLFFVSKNDGSHHFSATRAEHERMVDRYQRGGRPAMAAPPPR